MTKKYLIYILLFLFSVPGYSADFKKVDKYARSVKKSKDYRQLAKTLAAPFKYQKEKVRSIFVWIAHNIKYDYNKYKRNQSNGGRIRITGKSKREIALKRKKIIKNKLIKAYRLGKGVCEDYSYLFVAMCKAIGIESKFITGNARFSPGDIGKMPRYSNHAWNSVKIDGKWYLLDITWAAGETDFNTGIFRRNFQEGFFLTHPAIFILNHYPDNSRWQLLQKKVSKRQYANFAYIHGDFYNYEVKSFSPRRAYLSAKKKFETIKLKFKNKPPKLVYYQNGKINELSTIVNQNELIVKIPTYAKYNKSIVIGVIEDRKFKPIIEYKVK